jgi:hypothetical protein
VGLGKFPLLLICAHLAAGHGYVAEPHQRTVKLAPCGLACIFVGYSADHRAYRLWDPATCKVELARDVQFFENVFPAAGDHTDTQELIFDVVSFPEEDSQ